MSTQRQRSPRADGGFTLLELVVGMGLLAAMLAVLVQILAAGVGVFGSGERSQALADRTHTAARAMRRAFERQIGPSRLGSLEECDPTARLLVYRAPLGLDPSPARPRAQILRATIAFDEPTEARLLTDRLRDVAAEEVGVQDEQMLEARVRELVARWPRRGRGEILLAAWPQDKAGVLLELREGVWPSDPDLVPERIVPLAMVAAPEDLDLDPDIVRQHSRVVATGLLHVEWELWTQATTAWGNRGPTGPVTVWDSARAGLLLDDRRPDEVFPLDRGPSSRRDPRDDVFPRWVRIVMVVSFGSESPPEAILTAPLGATEREMDVNRVDRLPDLQQSPWLKVGAEWVRVQSPSDTRLGGLRRGERGTQVIDHPVGTAVRAGREVELIVRLPHGRDADV